LLDFPLSLRFLLPVSVGLCLPATSCFFPLWTVLDLRRGWEEPLGASASRFAFSCSIFISFVQTARGENEGALGSGGWRVQGVGEGGDLGEEGEIAVVCWSSLGLFVWLFGLVSGLLLSFVPFLLS
jgi:hypothetical protein